MKRSERMAHVKDFVCKSVIGSLNNCYPKAKATSDACYLPRDLSDADRIDAYDKLYEEAKSQISMANLGEIIEEYMEIEGHLTFFLNWTGDKTGLAKECINAPFYEFIEVMQNLEHFEDYYVAYKMPKKGQMSSKEKLNIRVDVMTRY